MPRNAARRGYGLRSWLYPECPHWHTWVFDPPPLLEEVEIERHGEPQGLAIRVKLSPTLALGGLRWRSRT